MSLLESQQFGIADHNPLDLIEQMFDSSGWPYERIGGEEISAAVKGDWAEYHLRFYWREEGKVLQTACFFDIKVPDPKKQAIFETLAMINERMWLGHFELWQEDSVLLFRHATISDNDALGELDRCETLIETALSECERYYPVFQFVIWANKSPAEAIEVALLDTVGNA